MTTAPDPADLHARQLHLQALAHTSPSTLARLRHARQAATAANVPSRRASSARPWLAGGALAAVLALAVVVLPRDPASAPAVAAATVATAASGEPVVPLQEDPGFYLWLASADATALAME
jgi:hypothetical protein